MDPLLERFYKQYKQQATNLTYPPAKLLVHSDIQRQLYRYFFDPGQDGHLPPPEYQRRVLKRLLAAIIKEVSDDDELYDDLMTHMGDLSSIPERGELELVQTPRILSYSLPDLHGAEIDVPVSKEVGCSRDNVAVANQRILIQESPQLMAAGSNVGLRTWEACLRLAYYLCTSAERPRMQEANVLELGAGTGLLSLVCSFNLGARHVIATDGLPHVVDGITHNIAVNDRLTRSRDENSDMLLARILDWTDPSTLTDVLTIGGGHEVALDYVLGADITYHPDMLDPLASLTAQLKARFPRCRVLISCTVRNPDTLALWRKSCRNHDLSIREINEKDDGWQCPQYQHQTGLFHEQAFPIVIMDIDKLSHG